MTSNHRPISEDDLQAYVDGRLSAEAEAAMIQYLREHPQVAARVRAYSENRDALRAQLRPRLEAPLPARLRPQNMLAELARRRRRRLTAIAAAAGWLVIGSVIGWTVKDIFPLVATAPRVPMEDAIAAHRTFVVEVRHPVELDASQSEHLAQWLSNRLGKAITIPDLRDLGLTFLGGRLLPTVEGPAAFFMYEDGKSTRVTFYVRPRAGMGTTAQHYVERNGVGALYWFVDGVGYAVTGAISQPKLQAAADSVQRQTSDGS